MNSFVLRAMASAVLLVGCTAASKSTPGFVSAFSDVGDGDGIDCDFLWLDCEGHPPKSLIHIGNEDARPLGKWLKNREWMTETGWIPREPKVEGGPKPQFQIMAINEAKRLRLLKIGIKGFVFAHIRARPDGPLDKRYEIGLRGDLTEDFFLVVDDVAPNTVAPQNNSWRVARWHVVGIESATGNAVKLGKTGNFRWCIFDHPKDMRKLGANFITCTAQHSLDSLAHEPAIQTELQGRSLQQELVNALFPPTTGPVTPTDISRQIVNAESVQNAQRKIFKGKELFDSQATALIVNIFRNIDTYPAWMVCGSGCCTADDI